MNTFIAPEPRVPHIKPDLLRRIRVEPHDIFVVLRIVKLIYVIRPQGPDWTRTLLLNSTEARDEKK